MHYPHNILTQLFKKTPHISITLLIVCTYAIYVWAYFPGYMSFDSALHFGQVESGEWTTFQPVIFLGLWKVAHSLIEGPGGMFLLLVFVYCLGLGLFVYGMNAKLWQKVIVTLLVVLAPINVMLLPHLWKDVALMSFLMLSLGLFTASRRVDTKLIQVAALTSLGLAVSFRFEAVLYLWPLVYYFVLCFSNKKGSILQGVISTGFKTSRFVVVVFVFNLLLTQWYGAKKITLWPTIALWDLAAVSIEVDENLLPEFTTGENMTVSDLSQAFRPWSNVPLFSKTKAGINTGLDLPFTDAQYNTLLQSWVKLPFTQTRAYFTHRWRLLLELLRVDEVKDKPAELFYAHQMVKYKSSYPPNNSVLNIEIEKWLANNTSAFYLQPWFYLLLGLLIVPLLSKGVVVKGKTECSEVKDNGLALTLSACAVLNVLVMFFLAPAAETRYLIVSMNFCLLLWPVIFFNRNKTSDSNIL